ncbi:putative glycolipid-binding domain-containing protein [Fictibacillus nanhaiensis]|uniref:Glycolipid-binding domain-containing protein n=1 Tax=Fictibacillus nanhaiensis TaxID=742169 RepID=A0ABS2ZS62_9BACL|nr:putative glycolipid-binding domain-containing protein [Fictibacillus nanhaiensis]
MSKQVMFWEKQETSGTEYLELTYVDHTLRAESTVLFIEEGVPQKVTYRVKFDPNWVVKDLYIKNHTLDKTLSLSSKEGGCWFDNNGVEIHSLRGAIDIDISCTPFTNSLPINRLTWRSGKPEVLQMVYVSANDLSFKKVKQVYTLIHDEETRTFHYSSRSFESPIIVDKNGFVIEYPELFKRKS